MRVTAETRIATRQRILDVARRLFAQQGFESATTRDIARAAQIATGTVFNYFPTKESIALCLVTEAHEKAPREFLKDGSDASLALEEDLFAYVATGLRKLKPYRKYLPVTLETSPSSSAAEHDDEPSSLRTTHLETVGHIISRHGRHEALSPLALQLYWTLYAGVLVFWAADSSPKQEDTLALLDQSLAMFVGWLAGETDRNISQPKNGG